MIAIGCKTFATAVSRVMMVPVLVGPGHDELGYLTHAKAAGCGALWHRGRRSVGGQDAADISLRQCASTAATQESRVLRSAGGSTNYIVQTPLSISRRM